MNEYKFRGKRVDNGQWVYGFYREWTMPEIWKDRAYRDGINYYIDEKGTNESHLVIPETVGQYTGLHDKNGKEVYKGDIVIYGNKIAVVVWDDDTCSFKLKYKENLYNMWAACEVIGNIHDNPELLKEGDTSE